MQGKPTSTKQEIRNEMRSRRKALPPEARVRSAKAICSTLIHHVPPSGAVAAYLASPDEIDLADFMRCMLQRGVTVAAPRWNGSTYELARLDGLSQDCLRRGPMNILEPAEANTVDPRDVAAWIVPGLAFARNGKRLGYGGGWYDRLLAASRKDSLKIGVAYGFQIVEDLPCEPHDIALTHIAADSEDDALMPVNVRKTQS